MNFSRKTIDLAFIGLAWAAVLLLFWPARNAGFVGDWLGWEYRYRAGSWADVANCFGYRGLLQVGQSMFFGMWQLFGRSGVAWLLVGTFFHALNGWLGWRLFSKILEKTGRFSSRAAGWAALPGALLFLFSPYVGEPIIWRVCLHYLASTAMVLGAMHVGFSFLENGSRRLLFAAHALGMLAIFTLEISLVYPVLLLVLAVFWHFSIKKENRIGSRIGQLVTPGAISWLLFFGLSKLLLGAWVGHYGAATHFKMNLETLSTHALKYLVKHAAFARYFETWKEKTMEACARPDILWPAVAAIFGLFAWWIFQVLKNRSGEKWVLFRASGLAFACFFIALGPALNLFFYDILWTENDRYSYFASLFWWQAAGLFLAILPKILRWPMLAGLLLNSLFLLRITVDTWQQNDRVYRGLVQDFRWRDARQVIILGIGKNLRGSYLFARSDGPSGFEEALELYSGEKYRGKMFEIAQFNMETWSDSFRIARDSTGRELIPVFNQYGNWWHLDGVHAFNKKAAIWTFRQDEWGNPHIAFPEKLPDGTVLIYQHGDRWQEAFLGD